MPPAGVAVPSNSDLRVGARALDKRAASFSECRPSTTRSKSSPPPQNPVARATSETVQETIAEVRTTCGDVERLWVVKVPARAHIIQHTQWLVCEGRRMHGGIEMCV